MIAFIAMLPRALFISPSPMISLWETAVITIIGASMPLTLDYYKRQEKRFKVTEEKLRLTQKELLSKVRLSKEQEKQLQVINTFSKMLNRPFKLNRPMKAITEMVMDVMGTEVVLMFSLNKDDESMSLVAHEGINDESAHLLDMTRLSQCVFRHMSEANHYLVMDDSKDSPILQVEKGLRTGLSVPLISNGEIMGSICVATFAKRRFRESDIEMLAALGNLIGVAMSNADLYRERESAISQLEIAVNKLKLSERKYRELFENAHDAIWVEDLSGTVVAANQAAAELFGCDLTELIGGDSRRFLPQKDTALQKTMQQDIANETAEQLSYKRKIVRPDGSEVFVMLTANLIFTDNKPEGYQFIGKNITREVRMQENQSFYLKQITKSYEEERQRISRELHDSTAQELSAMLRQLERFLEDNTEFSEANLATLRHFHRQLRDSLQGIRLLSRDLRPAVLDSLGLFPAVEWLAEQIENEYNIETRVTIKGKEKRFTPELEITFFRIIQEGLRNIAKHAEAIECNITIDLKDTETRIIIADNGKGFELPESLGALSLNGNLGIDSMQTRARLAGGTFDITSKPGEGTTILVTIPV
ncbi:MAG: PAS domain S-box protein [Candidatus Aquicultor sp.]|nr:PAS domain S-box protein [Candidatus Aquicultor sp.]